MNKVRCFKNIDGTIRVLHPNYPRQPVDEIDDAFIARTSVRAVECDPTLAGLPFIDVPQAEVLALDRSNRHKWRIVGQVVKVDHTIPDKPNPQQARLDAINAATTIDDLKTVLVDIIKK